MSRLRTVGTSVIAAVLMLGLVAGAASAQSPGATGETAPTATDAPTDGATEQATRSGTGSAGPGGKQITLWGGDWNTVTVLNHIAGTILEESYGYDVNYVETAFGNARASLSKDEGRIDATMEIWCINVPGWCDQHVAPAGQGGADEPAVRLSPVFENAKQGWYVPRYLVEGENAPARGLESVTQLGQFADLFASPSNPGQGRLIAGVSGWNVTEKGVIKMHALGLADDFDAQVVGSQAAMDSQVVSAFRNEEPLLLYYWKPIWVTGEYDLVKLDFPSQWSQSCQDLLGRELQEGPPYDDVPERAACEYRGSDIAPVVDADLERTDPQAYGLMDRMFVERNQIAQAAATYVTTNQSADEVAAQFLREHPQRVESWTPGPPAAPAAGERAGQRG